MKKYRNERFGFFVLLFGLALVLVAGCKQSDQIYAPEACQKGSGFECPLVFSLSHAMGSPDDQNAVFCLDQFYEGKEGEYGPFILIVPDAANYNGMDGWALVSVEDFQKILNEIKDDYSVDSDRIYIVGHSAGAIQSINYGASDKVEYENDLALIMPIAGYGKDADNEGIPYRPKSAMFIHGTSDNIFVPYSDAVDLFGRYADYLNCAIYSERTPIDYDGNLNIELESWTDCDCGTFVEFYHAVGEGHMVDYPAVFVERALKKMLSVVKPEEGCM